MSFWNIILPLSTAALATVAIFSFIQHWNEFIGPLIFLNSTEKFTVSIGLRYFMVNPFESDEPREAILMAASTIVAIAHAHPLLRRAEVLRARHCDYWNEGVN